MIVSYRDRRTAACAAGTRVRTPPAPGRIAWLKLARLGAVPVLDDLLALPSDRLEALEGDRSGQYAIRVDEQWRICFEWPETLPGPINVELVDCSAGATMAFKSTHPGEHLAEELGALNMSATELARHIKVPPNRVTGILNGQRAITGDTALRLAHFFGTSAELWLNLQTLHDLHAAEASGGSAIGQLPTLKQLERPARRRRPQRGGALAANGEA